MTRPAMCRSAARRGSDRSWKMQDPQLPKSIWYFSDAQFVGFRIVRPLKVPPPEADAEVLDKRRGKRLNSRCCALRQYEHRLSPVT